MAAPPAAGHTLSAPPPWVLALVAQCDWQCRGTLPQLNRAWRGALAGSDAFWRRCAVDLASQRSGRAASGRHGLMASADDS
eukprot:jgi/Tetstr1/455302/TSEL_042137.t1